MSLKCGVYNKTVYVILLKDYILLIVNPVKKNILYIFMVFNQFLEKKKKKTNIVKEKIMNIFTIRYNFTT